MKKRILTLSIIFYVIFNINAENILQGKRFHYSEIVEGIIIDFEEDYLKIKEYDHNEDKNIEYTKPYKVVYDSGLMFILSGENFEDKWLCLYSEEIMILYDDEGSWFFLGKNAHIKTSILLFMVTEDFFSISSYLTETTKTVLIEYDVNNLVDLDIPKPWVEGVKGYGIGEKIYSPIIKEKNSSDLKLVISNGYVSYNRPDLYKKNSRIKTIRVRDNESGRFKDFTIPDSPNIYQFSIYDVIGRKGFEIEILDVYKGTHYDDTCINFLGMIDLVGY